MDERRALSAWPEAVAARPVRIESSAPDGTVEVLGAIGQAEMMPGDVFVIATPGGGGYGASRGR